MRLDITNRCGSELYERVQARMNGSHQPLAQGFPGTSGRDPGRQIQADGKYGREVKTIGFPHGSHLTGLMPNREREKRLYRMIPLVGLMHRTFGKYRRENMACFEQSERAIIEWVKEL